MTSGIPAVDVLVAVAAAITALGVIWKKGLRPIIRAAQRTEEALPVILSIAEEFKANGGSSLRDSIDTIAREGEALSAYAHGFKHDFANRLAVVAGHQELLTERVDALSVEVRAVKDDVAEVKTIVDSRKEPR